MTGRGKQPLRGGLTPARRTILSAAGWRLEISNEIRHVFVAIICLQPSRPLLN
jgi:hypothetical protein